MEHHDVRGVFEQFPDVVDTKDLCKMLGGISKKLAYHLLRHGKIPSIRIGREYKIAKVDVIDFLLHHTEASSLSME